jgi:DHA1 family inner membrane transport protein
VSAPGSSARTAVHSGAALGALAVCAFVIGCTEFVVPGLLPQIASTYRVSITTAGLLVSGYAIGVVIGAPLMTALVVCLPRKQVLIGLLVLSVAGNLISTVAPSYSVMLVGRAVAALCHGAFFGVGAVVAASLVAPARQARAIATMFLGITAANLIGVPIGTLVGQHLGWRTTFAAMTVLGALSMIGVAACVPRVATTTVPSLRRELASFGQRQLWLALGMTALGFGAVYAPLTYVAPLVTTVAGYPSSAITWLLVVFGLGFVIGNLAGARAADTHLMPTLIGLLAGMVVILAVFPVTAHGRISAAVTLFLLGACAYATVPGFTTRVINSAADAESSTLASSAAVAAFNLGNAAGAYLGGVALTASHTAADTAWAGAAMAAGGLVLALLSARSAPSRAAC